MPRKESPGKYRQTQSVVPLFYLPPLSTSRCRLRFPGQLWIPIGLAAGPAHTRTIDSKSAAVQLCVRQPGRGDFTWKKQCERKELVFLFSRPPSRVGRARATRSAPPHQAHQSPAYSARRSSCFATCPSPLVFATPLSDDIIEASATGRAERLALSLSQRERERGVCVFVYLWLCSDLPHGIAPLQQR